MARPLSVCALAASVLLSLGGCGTAPQARAPEPTPPRAATASPAAMKIDGKTVHLNARGDVECPVMNVVIRDPSTAEFVEHQGVRYYLCCDACVTQMRMDPGTWAERAQGR